MLLTISKILGDTSESMISGSVIASSPKNIFEKDIVKKLFLPVANKSAFKTPCS